MSNDFLETVPECFLLIPVLRTKIKKVSHSACLRDMMGHLTSLMLVLIVITRVISSAQGTFCGS